MDGVSLVRDGTVGVGGAGSAAGAMKVIEIL